MTISRRALLTGAAGAGAASAAALFGVAEGVLPGRTRLVESLDAVRPGGGSSHPRGALRRGRFVSTARSGADVGWLVAYPPAADPVARTQGRAAQARLPVVVALHGLGGDENAVADDLDLPGHLADAVADGVPPFAIAAVAGGRGYWHPRRSGDDAGRMVSDEFLSLLAGLPGDAGSPPLAAGASDHVGLFGWSMGGYGALLLAERLRSPRVVAVAVSSPALWRTPGESAPGAFDDAADFARSDVFAGRGHLRGIAVRVDCGDADPFADATRAFVAGLPARPDGGFTLGAHDDAYWRRIAPAQLAFLGRALAAR